MEDNKGSTKKHKVVSFFLIILLVIIITILYSRYVSTTGLQIIENSIVDEELPSSFNGFKIVQFADIHYGKTTTLEDIKDIVKNINKLKPDLVIFTGDLFDKDIKVNEDDITSLKDEFSKN